MGVERQVRRRHRRRVLLRRQRAQCAGAGAGGDDVHAGGDDGGLVEVSPRLAVRHREGAALAAVAARGERREHAILLARADRDHPGRLRVRVVGVFARAVIAGGEDADDAALVELVRRDAHRVHRIELSRGAPGVAGDADRVVEAELVRRRIVQAADRVQDEECAARAVAHQLRAGRHAAVQAARTLAGAADGAGDMGAVARATEVGVELVLDIQHRRDARAREVVGQAGEDVLRGLDVLHDVLAELQVLVGRVDAGVVHHHGHAAAAVGNRAAEVGRVLDHPRGAADLALLLVEEAQRGVEIDRSNVVARGQSADLGGGRQRAGDRQGVHVHAAVDAQVAQRGDLGGGDRSGLLVAGDDLQVLGGRGAGEQAGEFRVDPGLGDREAAGEHADRQGRQAGNT